MQPRITATRFGGITLQMGDAAVEYTHDILIGPDGRVDRRKKKLSKQVYGTSHRISLAEAEHIYRPDADQLLIGSGKFGRVKLSDEASAYLAEKGMVVTLLPTPKAADAWNERNGRIIGLFHVTC